MHKKNKTEYLFSRIQKSIRSAVRRNRKGKTGGIEFPKVKAV
jgi:hypothetical protein